MNDTKTIPECYNMFERLTSMNVSLTNSCNLSCTYCYEQHKKNYGTFTVETLKQAYDFLMFINKNPDKNFIFFGGEPLIHEKLILNFLRTYKQTLTENKDKCQISMVSNGTLLTPQFIDEYFSYGFTQLFLSLDTFDVENDARNFPSEKLNTLKENTKLIPKNQLTVRSTITYKTAETLVGFLDECYGLGVRNFILQPLVMGNKEGFLDWDDDKWEKLQSDIFLYLWEYKDINVEVTEGVGTKSYGNTCLNKMDIISIDPTGDFSGCFFFVNQKEKADSLMSGNIFQNKVYYQRQEMFDTQYREMLETDEQCKTCDLQDNCYQCPAGNLDTGGKLFRSDSMCQRFVKFYQDLKVELVKIRYKDTAIKIIYRLKFYGADAFSLALLNYMKKEFPHLHLNFFTEKELVKYYSFDELVGAFIRLLDHNQEDLYLVLEEKTTGNIEDLFNKLVGIKKINVIKIQTPPKVDPKLYFLSAMGATMYGE
jgi:radical SAM protein with 4Fe4S-binding SPASM domain